MDLLEINDIDTSAVRTDHQVIFTLLDDHIVDGHIRDFALEKIPVFAFIQTYIQAVVSTQIKNVWHFWVFDDDIGGFFR